MKEKPRCSGRMTESQFISFVKSQLRKASWKWFPVPETQKKARTRKGFYLCNICKQEVPTTKVVNGKRRKNVSVDHILPIINPITGFTTWDDFINGLFCEEENLQLICSDCHDKKTSEEKAIAKQRKKNGRD